MANLPVREMVLYKHGVGFFVRQGEVDGEQVNLTFRRDEVNDVLKSLAVFDQGGGQVLGIHYQTPMDVQARLASSSVNLSQSNTLRDLIRDLRGRQCEITVETTPGTQEVIRGRVIGVDFSYSNRPSDELGQPPTVSLLTEQGVQVFELNSLRNIKIADDQSAHDLDYFLDTSMSEDDRRVVTVRLSEGQHDLAVYYVAPSPTWRVSYRLVAESEEDGSTGSALLQGWGLFDNRLEEDLENVRVTLVAGQPISFIYELYASRIPERPTVEDESRIAPGPIEYESAPVAKEPPNLGAAMSRNVRARAMADTAQMDNYAVPPEDQERGRGSLLRRIEKVQAEQSAPSSTETKDAGETFQYAVTTPVTVKRGESALVPILNNEVQYERELLYNGDKLAKHPVAALRFDNTTGLTLERGPVTVVEDGDYKGDAVVAFTKEDQQVYLPYAVELGVKITERLNNEVHVVGVKIEKGAFFEQFSHQRTTRYIIENSTKEAKNITIEAPILPEYDLYETPPPAVETAEERRWRVDVPAGDKTEFVRQERNLIYERKEIQRLSYDRLRQYLEKRYLDQAIYEELKEILDLFGVIDAARADLRRLEQERNAVYEEQEQLRANLGALQPTGQEASLRNRLLGKLESTQDRLDAIARETTNSQQTISQTQQRVEEAIAGLE
jgi:hypothetical protein